MSGTGGRLGLRGREQGEGGADLDRGLEHELAVGLERTLALGVPATHGSGSVADVDLTDRDVVCPAVERR